MLFICYSMAIFNVIRWQCEITMTISADVMLWQNWCNYR